jgi:hypothetical protein
MKPLYKEVDKIKFMFRRAMGNSEIHGLFEIDPDWSRWRSIHNIYFVTLIRGNDVIVDYLITPLGKVHMACGIHEKETVKSSTIFLNCLKEKYDIIEMEDVDCYRFHWFEDNEPFERGPASFKKISISNYSESHLEEKIYKLIPSCVKSRTFIENDRIFYAVELPNGYELFDKLLAKLK